MKSSTYIALLLAGLFWAHRAAGQVSVVQNFVIRNEIKKPGVTTSGQVAPLTVTEYSQVVNYVDGLGRPLQTVSTRSSTDQKDVITPFNFDGFGRKTTEYLPYSDVSGTAYGSLRTNAYSGQANFYSPANTSIPGVARDSKPVEQNSFEVSPLNRVLEKGAPGQNFQPGGSHAVKTTTSLNAVADSVKKWTIAASAAAVPVGSSYAASELTKLITTDEHGKMVVEYRDKENRMVLKKVQLLNTANAAHTGWLSTYYVYDDFSNLRCIIPPKAVEVVAQDWSFSTRTWLLDSLCYRYDYDGRGRVITKKNPWCRYHRNGI